MKQTATTDDQRRVLEIANTHPDATVKDITGMLNDVNIGVDYVQEVLHNFELPEESSNGTTPKGTTPNTMDETDPDDDPELDALIEDEIDRLTGKTRDVIERVLKDPSTTVDEIEADGNVSRSQIINAVRSNSHLIDADAAIWKGAPRPELVTSVDEITATKKRAIVEAILEDPTRTHREVHEVSGASKSYVPMVQQEYTHLLPAEWVRRHEPIENRLAFYDEFGDNPTGIDALFGDTEEAVASDAFELFGDDEEEPEEEDEPDEATQTLESLATADEEEAVEEAVEEADPVAEPEDDGTSDTTIGADTAEPAAASPWPDDIESDPFGTEPERLKFLTTNGVVERDDYEERIRELIEDEKLKAKAAHEAEEAAREVLENEEARAEARDEARAEAEEAAQAVIDAAETNVETDVHPHLREYDTVVHVEGDRPEGDADVGVLVDETAIETLRTELEGLEAVGTDELAAYAGGIRHALELLGQSE